MSASFFVTNHIPVPDHVYKFLLKRCGTNHITATRHTFIGSLTLTLLTKNNDVKVSSTPNSSKIFKVDIHEQHFKKLGHSFTSRSAKLFNDQIDAMFRDELYYYAILNKVNNKKLYAQSIRAFLEMYDITENDIKIETLIKGFNRKKSKIETNLLS